MFEQQPPDLRQKVKELADRFLDSNDPSGWFDVLYADAAGDAARVPWARLTVHWALQNWIDRASPQGEGKSALVVGCGLGDDAEALARLGFRVTAFDIAPTAIAWCRQRFPDSAVNYTVGDIFAPDPSWVGAFDLVFESRNLQALPVSARSRAIEAIVPLVAPNGTLLVFTRYRDTDAAPDGPPWPLSETELDRFRELGLVERDRHPFPEGEGVQQFRIEYRR
ncbi:MAG TPA: class I SAM-dependent methyltransferase [Oscillatoriales cyanobacterium M59_W2019_021]|nr:MAG: class I SAM-dependent methyltransferase [Cyanobacteria bacterium J055]HIK31647.1 class I SAM-dependent methyltransferase [Oscillatoriales cyanobacterium M4454_W2019_049]HIK50346.1 class I SAM-dependent methyltransferase [Oscillatoriales cyanobacterium M59_W2019_021]